MATTTATITWMPVAGSLGYKIEYKLKSSSVWLTPGPPTNPANPTLALSYDLLVEEGEEYDGRISSMCNTGGVRFRFFDILPPDPTPVLIWEEDTYQCTQTGSGFNLADTYTGFSSPSGIYWDAPLQRFYVVDADDVNGNFWWFDPDTITGYASANHIAGSTSDINIFVFDQTNRRIIAAGDQSDGAKVLDISTGSISSLNYGTNASPGTARRTPLGLSDTILYAFCNLPNVVRLYNRTTLAFLQEINKTSIPSNGTYLVGGYHVIFVNSEIWVPAAARGNGNIARYNSDFTSLLGTITLTGIATAYSGLYWMGQYHDESQSRIYIGDFGSKRYYVLDHSGTILLNQPLTNFRGKQYCEFSFTKNELDGSIYMQAKGTDSLGDPSPNYKLYRLNSTTGAIEAIYPDATAVTLALRAGTSEQWGVTPGLRSWDGSPGWDTDGLVLKYI